PLPGQGHRELGEPGRRRGALREGGAALPRLRRGGGGRLHRRGQEDGEGGGPPSPACGGAVVVGCIDEDKQQGMAVSRTRKLDIAARSFDLLTGKYGLPARDLIFDPLVFPVGTGDVNYVGSAVETIEGLRAIKERFPECRTIRGLSNVSFGPPPPGREVLNAVFLYH